MLGSETEKSICYIVATENGDFPATPQKKVEGAYSQMPLCVKYRPQEKWKVFEVTQKTRYENRTKTLLRPEIKGVKRDLQEKIFGLIKDRHNCKILGGLI